MPTDVLCVYIYLCACTPYPCTADKRILGVACLFPTMWLWALQATSWAISLDLSAPTFSFYKVPTPIPEYSVSVSKDGGTSFWEVLKCVVPFQHSFSTVGVQTTVLCSGLLFFGKENSFPTRSQRLTGGPSRIDHVRQRHQQTWFYFSSSEKMSSNFWKVWLWVFFREAPPHTQHQCIIGLVN